MLRLRRSTTVPMAERPAGDDQISFPVPWHRTVLGFRWPLGDHHIFGDVPVGFAPPLGTGPRFTQRPPGAQSGNEFTLERPTSFNIQRLVDRFMTDTHALIIGEIDLQTVRNLLRAPGSEPFAVRPMGLVQ